LPKSDDLNKYASELFDKLRNFDEQGADVILVEPVPEIGIGAAIMNRLRKAAMK
jgi:L-threonylcarbamoyladenylate synthase